MCQALDGLVVGLAVGLVPCLAGVATSLDSAVCLSRIGASEVPV